MLIKTMKRQVVPGTPCPGIYIKHFNPLRLLYHFKSHRLREAFISITSNKRVFHLVNFGTEKQALDLIERGKTCHFRTLQEHLIVLIRET